MNKDNQNNKKLLLALIIAAVVVLVIALFALSQKQITQDAQVEELETISDSDELGVIEKEINSTDLNSLDRGIGETDEDFD